MKTTMTDQEQKVLNLFINFDDVWDTNGGVCSIVKKDGRFRIEVSAMYSLASITFDKLQKLNEILGTTECNLTNESYYPGCETCDYGSEQIYFFEAW